MNFGILVLEGPYTHQASDSAWHFARAAIERGHQVPRVFFYHDGVHNASRLTTPPQDDRHVVRRWQALAEEHGVDLVACVAAAQRRGLVDEAERRRHGKDADNIAPGFRISGLGQLLDLVVSADRMVVFGD
jgi:tRNA 2-thiouridine synthesizing protein D